MQPRSCLVLKNDGIGDLIASSGIIASLAAEFGGGLDLVTCEQNRELAAMIPGVRHIYHVSRDGLRFLPAVDRLGLFVPAVRGPARAWTQDFGVLAALRAHEYDVAISLRRFIRASTLALMRQCRARRRFAAFEFCTNLPAERSDRAAAGWTRFRGNDQLLSEQAYFATFLRAVVSVNVDIRPRLHLPVTSTMPEPRRVGVCLSGASMRWEPSRWLQLIAALSSASWQVVLFGGADCQEDARRIVSAYPQCESLVGQLDFHAAVAPLRSLCAYIGNDTGFSHFASLVVPRCLILTGGGTHGRFFPWPGATNQYVVYFGLECFDCDWRCKYPQRLCLVRLDTDSVLRCFEDMTASDWRGPTWKNLNPLAQQYQIAWRHKKKPVIGTFT
jgi:ADP-heptose:LPS heptosyltransferase